MNSKQRILLNTFAQYIRTVLCMTIAFISTRVVLTTLGVEDYGIYSVVAGAVSILSFLTNSMVITTQRFLSISQGENDIVKTKSIFNNSVILHAILTGILLVSLLFLYLILFDGVLNIPLNSIKSAKMLYFFVTLVLCLSFVSSPYKAVIVSHENIVYISIIEIIDAILKLTISYYLALVQSDKLIVYGFLLSLIQVFNFFSLSIYSYKKYPECSLLKFSNFSLLYVKELFHFAGWTMYNLICNLGRVQGLAIVLNRFMGPIVNASYGLAFQVSGALNNVSASLLNAINPQLMKAEGAGDRAQMIKFAELECKFAFYLLSAVSIPCFFEMPKLLYLWLGQVPDYSILFCRMVLFASLVDTMSTGLGSALQAIGNIRKYTLVIYTIKFLTLPVAAICLHLGYSIIIVAIVYVAFELISSFMRIPFFVRFADAKFVCFFKNVLLRITVPFLVLILSCIFIFLVIDSPYRFILTFSYSIVIYIISIYLWGLNKKEKEYSRSLFAKIKDKFI